MNNEPPQQATSLPDSLIPIVVGITGHRDLRLDDIPRLEGEVRKIFLNLKHNYPDTPLITLSPLAEGADRLVARIGLEQGAQLYVPLPLPRAEYEKDFNTPESGSEFNQLIEQSAECFELPLLIGNTPENIREYGPERNLQYTQVGAFIVRHSHVLIALWDGTDNGLEGGTAQIVEYKLKGIPETYKPLQYHLEIIDTGPVYHIVTPRQRNPQPQGEPFSFKLLLPLLESDDTAEQKAHFGMLERINNFNRNLTELASRVEQKIRPD